MDTFASIKSKVRELLADPDGQWVTDDVLATWANQVYQQQLSYLSGTAAPFETKLVEVPNVPGGTASLDTYQATGQLLAGLVKPRLLQAKIAGTPASAYREVREYDVLPTALAGTPLGAGGWEWRAYVIWLLGWSQAMDLQVRGDFLLPPLSKDTDLVRGHPMQGHALAYGTAALGAAVVGNEQWQSSYAAQAEQALDALAGQMVRQQQRLTFRVGRMNGGGRGRGRF